ncbi:3-carboxy-cis-cis-mucoante lactonizing enzyme [Apiospora arundinis]|uniref:3-carboxy-cis-cis-mucoante lactonizing enzyme n=1 Tax=Apiospora arundinis TaxID=335852 RepID=A0ABR2I3X7_9PEZI
MKKDNYKNLCLAQALNSPLRHRHGCIIVKGGKVIGQGFNDVRSGFDGGALKTGQLPLAAAPRHVSPADDLNNATAAKSKHFTPAESIASMGGGPLANTPFTMHSEMMAINSALSSSSTLAATTVSSIKPCYKLPGDTKRKRELRRGAVAVFVDRVCRAELEQGIQQGTASISGSDRMSLQAASSRSAGPYQEGKESKSQNYEAHHYQANYYEPKKSQGKYKHYKKRTSRTMKQQHQQQSTFDASLNNSVDGEYDTETAPGIASLKSTKSLEVSEKKPRHHITEPVQNHMLLPKARAHAGGRNLRDRMKHPKLVGADLFVIHLNNSTEERKRKPGKREKSKTSCHVDIPQGSSSYSAPDSLKDVSTGSLYDELSCKEPVRLAPAAKHTDESHLCAGESRPCYRCVAYMDSVGIKRVVWTNASGDWECAKVSDLVQMLEGSMGDESSANIGLFVTKHEVLRLRRVFGDP